MSGVLAAISEERERGVIGLITRILTVFVTLLIMAVLFVAISAWLFRKSINSEIDKIIDGTGDSQPGQVSLDDLAGLPEPVQRYLKYALKDGQHAIQNAHLKQNGLFRTRDDPTQAADEGWRPIKAEQYFITERPAFFWFARINMAPLMWIKGWDKYDGGEGNMKWKMLSAITVLNARDKMLNQGTLSRYLAEMPWFPTAMLPGKHLSWEAIDSNTARAIITDHGLKVAVVFHFNAEGQIIRSQMPNRARMVGNRYFPTPWSGYYYNYQEHGGMMIPTEAEVMWNLDKGDFSYAKLKITGIDFNTLRVN